VFGESHNDFLALQEGDSVAVRGTLKADLYQGKISLSIMADKILPLKVEESKAKVKTEPAPDNRSRQERLAGRWSGSQDGPSDDLPDFGGL
jgi:hypothetical protein